VHAVRVHEIGDASKLSYDEVPVPEPKAGEVRVKVAAVGLNFVEIYNRKGIYPNTLPVVLGGEFAGTVDAVGAGVTELKPGDRVATASGAGAYADYALAAAWRLVKLPDGVSLELGAATLLQGMTAHYLALSTYPLKPGDVALVHAGAGGVGQLLVQIAKKRGARVIATVSTDEKAKLAREAGADDIIMYTRDDFEAETKRLTEGKGVDVVYDSVGKTTFMKGLNCLKPRGLMALYGASSGPVEPLNLQILNQKGSLFVTRPTLGHYVLTREELAWRAGELFKWIAAGELKVRVDRKFALKEAAAAHTYMEDRNTKGKVLLIP
jgi:NADPH2:quinone reductase